MGDMHCKICGADSPTEQWYIGDRPVPICRPCWDTALAATGLEGQPAAEAAFGALCVIAGEKINGPLRKDVLLRPPTARMVTVAERPATSPRAELPTLRQTLVAIPLHHCPLCCPDPDTVAIHPDEHEEHAMSLSEFMDHVASCVEAHPERLNKGG